MWGGTTLMNQDKIGSFIAELRKQKDLTQAELADKLNITQAAVSKWERGCSFPDLFLIEELSNILGVKISELLNAEKLPESLPLEKTDEIVTQLLDESSVHSAQQKKQIGRLKIIVASLLFVIIVLTLIIRYYTAPPTFDIVDSYYEDNDPYFEFYDHIYTVVVKYNGYVTEKDFDQYKEIIKEKYKKNFSNADAILILYYKDSYYNLDNISYTHISVLLP